ncbi:MAG: BlaI/MecI/CopY family transcriptional regulator [Lachnospiraceae bacterium]|nr:BlaI/MecI/CopY family transcriptional regulator [Lachnospiraceae bacterium]
MQNVTLGVVESQFADIIWENEPISSSELVKIAEEKFSWKRTTTHTVIKRLCEKELFENTKGIVTSLVSRDDFYSMSSKQFVNESFNGHLPAFIAAFTKGKRLSPEEAEDIRKLIDDAEEK